MKRALVCGAALLVGLGVAPIGLSATPRHAPAGASSTPLQYVAHLRLHVVTTSDVTSVALSPGWFAATRLSGVRGSGNWHVQTSALVLTGGNKTRGTKTATLDVIEANLTSDRTFHVAVAKGGLGVTKLTVSAVSDGRPTVVRTVVDRRSGSQPRGATIPRSRLMNPQTSQLPRADPRRLVLAFYYPWYPSYHQIGMADRPRDPRSTFGRAGVNAMTAQAKANGIDGFVQSWAGQHADGKQFRLALSAAKRHHQVLTGYLESAMAKDNPIGSVNRELNWLVQLLRYGKSPQFLTTHRGIPVVFVYSMDSFSPDQWRYILHELHERFHLRVALVGDQPASGYLPLEWGLHAYSANSAPSVLRNFDLSLALLTRAQTALRAKAPEKVFAATVSPGYDNRLLNRHPTVVVPRDGGRRYRQTWRAARAGQPDWIVITSWNEWFEDTAIEPGRKHGATALKVTRNESKAWKRS